ncbi:MAG: META domain-containing protein [Chloroflexi bacterium CFX2]|nr:META domain-containing protein [Chloroflexi bacterium CFX2]
MFKKLSARRKLIFLIAIVFLTVTTIATFAPSSFLSVPYIAYMMLGEVMFRLKGNTGIVWDALGSKGPGYANLQVFTHDGDISNYPGMLITFQVELDTTETPLLCQGQVLFFRSDPSYIDLDWQDDKCAEQHQIVKLAHFTLNNDGLYAVLPEEGMYPASSLLMEWIDGGKINLQSIRNTRMRDLVDSRIHPDSITSEIKLNGTRWMLRSLNSHELRANTIITLEFDAKTVFGRGGCNRHGANYAIQPNYGFKVYEGGWTKMECREPEGVMEQESEYLSAFGSVTNYYLMEENMLFLANEQEGVLLLYQLLPKFDVLPENLMGKTWKLVWSNALNSVKADTFTLLFDETKLSGTTSCRSYEGMYYIEDDILRVLSISMGTATTCSDEDNNAEANYIALLSAIWQYNIVDTQLQIYTEFGALEFELVSSNTDP